MRSLFSVLPSLFFMIGAGFASASESDSCDTTGSPRLGSPGDYYAICGADGRRFNLPPQRNITECRKHCKAVRAGSVTEGSLSLPVDDTATFAVDFYKENNWFEQAGKYDPGEAYTDIWVRVEADTVIADCDSQTLFGRTLRDFFGNSYNKSVTFALAFTQGSFARRTEGLVVPVFTLVKDQSGSCEIDRNTISNAAILRLKSSSTPIHVTGIFTTSDQTTSFNGISSRLAGTSSMATAINVGLSILDTPLNGLLNDAGLTFVDKVESRNTTLLALHPKGMAPEQGHKAAVRFDAVTRDGRSLAVSVYQHNVISIDGGLGESSNLQAALARQEPPLFVEKGSGDIVTMRAAGDGVNWPSVGALNTAADYRALCASIKTFSANNRLSAGAERALLKLARDGETEDFWNTQENNGICGSEPSYGYCYHRSASEGVPRQSQIGTVLRNALGEVSDRSELAASRRDLHWVNVGEEYRGRTNFRELRARLDQLSESKSVCFYSLETPDHVSDELSESRRSEIDRTGSDPLSCGVVFFKSPQENEPGTGWHVLQVFSEQGGRFADIGNLSVDIDPRAYLRSEALANAAAKRTRGNEPRCPLPLSASTPNPGN